jgi:type IV secretion system protein VirB8
MSRVISWRALWPRVASASAPFMQKTPAQTPLGLYPDSVHVPSLASRQLLWMARAVSWGLCVSMSCNLALICLLIGLFPLKHIEPFLVTVADKSEKIVRIEPIEQSIPGYQLLVEQMLRRYVIDRESITPLAREMEYRWSPGGNIAQFTSPAAFQIFQKQVPEYRRAFTSGLTRQVTIRAVNRITSTYWSVEFSTQDEDQNGASEALRSDWHVTILLAFKPQHVGYDQRFLNPVGLTVTHYSVVKQNTNSDTSGNTAFKPQTIPTP